MRFLLLHDGQSRGSDTIRNFFTDMYDAFVKVTKILVLWQNLSSLLIVGSTESVLCAQHSYHLHTFQEKSSADCKETSQLINHTTTSTRADVVFLYHVHKNIHS